LRREDRGMEHRRLLIVGVAVAVAVILFLRLLHDGGTHARPIPPLLSSHAHARVAAQLVVDVAGAVRRPGLYHLAAGTRIADAVAAAGGATAKADITLVNLAAPLADGEQVLVPARGAVTASASSAPSPTAPLDLNTASLEQLDALPGVGPATAQKIVDYRQAHGPFRNVDELEAVPGIGPAKLAQLKGLVIP
jgi:competence protein ComEA